MLFLCHFLHNSKLQSPTVPALFKLCSTSKTSIQRNVSVVKSSSEKIKECLDPEHPSNLKLSHSIKPLDIWLLQVHAPSNYCEKRGETCKSYSILRHSLESFPLYFPSRALNEVGSYMEKNPAWSTFSCVEPQQPQQPRRADGRGISPQFWQLIVWMSSPFSQKWSWKADNNLFWLSDEELWWKTAGSHENLIFHWECFLVYTGS